MAQIKKPTVKASIYAARNRRLGFTLVEVLTVLVLLSVMGSMVLTAMRGVARTAKEARTKSIIEAIDHVIQQQYDSYRYRALAVEVPDTFNPYDDGNPLTSTEIGYEVLATESARVRLMMLRDLQRMEMPDRFTDITSGPVVIRAACNPVLLDASGNVLASRNDKTQRRMMQVNWYGTGNDVPSRLAAYQDRLSGSQTEQHQGAECLYMIMSTSFVGGSPAIDVIPETNIGDTDGDLMPEILDGWQRPIEFIRWPVGYDDVYQITDSQLADDFDLFRSDYAYLANPSLPPPPSPPVPTFDPSLPIDPNNTGMYAQRFPWSVRPLVVSAGDDDIFGIALNPWLNASLATSEQKTFSYQDVNWNWPITEPYYGVEFSGRTRGVGSATFSAAAGHPFPDPYLRRFVAANGGASGFVGCLPGQKPAGDNYAEAAQNDISNYSLQVEQ